MKKLIVLGGLLVGVAAAGFLAWRFVFASAGLSGDDLKYLPNDCQLVVSMNVEEVLASDAYRKMKQDVKDFEKNIEEDIQKETGISANRLARATIGFRFTSGSRPDVVGVLRTRSTITPSEIQGAKKVREYKKNFKHDEITIGKYTIYQESYVFSWSVIDRSHTKGDPGSPPPPVPEAKREKGSAFCVIDSTTVLFGEADVLRKVLERDKAPDLSDNMKQILKQADFSKTYAMAFDLKAAVPTVQENLRREFRGLAGFSEALGNMEGLAASVGVKGAQITADASLYCKDAKSAEDARKMIDGALVLAKNALKELPEVPKEVPELIDAIKVAASGAKVTATVKGTGEPLIDWAKRSADGASRPTMKATGFGTAAKAPPPIPSPEK